MTLFFLRLKLTRFLRYFKKGKAGKLITAGLFFAVFFGVAIGIYQFFLKGFIYLHLFPFFETSLLLYSFELFFLLLGFLVWFGSMISLLFGLFKSKSQVLYLISPKFSLVPTSVLLSTFISSAWMFLFLMLPSLFAVSVFYKFSVATFLVISLSGLLLLAILVVFAYCCVLGVAHILRLINKKFLTFKNLSLWVGILVLAGFILLASKFSHHDILVTLSVENLKITKAPLEPITSLFKWLPSNTAPEAIIFGQLGNAKSLGLVLIKLLALLIPLVGLAVLASKKFLYLWQQLSEGNHIANQNSTAQLKLSGLPLPKNGFQAVLYKEVILLFRNTKNLFWLLFLALLWLSYVGFNYSLQKRFAEYQYSIPALPKILLAMQLLVLVYFVSAMVLRFAFPSFSSERNTAWIFSSTPLSFKKLLWAKFLFFSTVFSMFSLAVEIFNAVILHFQLGNISMFLWLSLCATLFISALGLFFGARFPNFETDDAQSLGTSIPGLVFTFASILYGALATLFYYTYITSGSTLVPNLFSAFSIILAFALIQNAATSIGKIDFVVNRQ